MPGKPIRFDSSRCHANVYIVGIFSDSWPKTVTERFSYRPRLISTTARTIVCKTASPRPSTTPVAYGCQPPGTIDTPVTNCQIEKCLSRGKWFPPRDLRQNYDRNSVACYSESLGADPSSPPLSYGEKRVSPCFGAAANRNFRQCMSLGRFGGGLIEIGAAAFAAGARVIFCPEKKAFVSNHEQTSPLTHPFVTSAYSPALASPP